MAKSSSVMVGTRLPRALYEFIEKDIMESGEFLNTSDWLTESVRAYIMIRKKITIDYSEFDKK